MSTSNARLRKLQSLTRSLAKRDFASARRILDTAGGAGPRVDAAPPAIATGGESPASDETTFIAVPPSVQGHGASKLVIEQACPGTVGRCVLPGGDGQYWLIRRRLAEISADSTASRQLAAVLRGARQQIDELDASPALCHTANCQPQDVLFMDIETCGLSGTAIFLVGTMFWLEDDLVFEQYFAKDYSQERAVLKAFADRLELCEVLVTFNGKAFDMNQIRERLAFHGLSLPERKCPHLDLLPESRKRWRKRLPNCKLQTLERVFCRRLRQGDIPGWAIPEAYHRFVGTGDAGQVRDIVHHNMLDLLTMAELLCAVLTGCEPADL